MHCLPLHLQDNHCYVTYAPFDSLNTVPHTLPQHSLRLVAMLKAHLLRRWPTDSLTHSWQWSAYHG